MPRDAYTMETERNADDLLAQIERDGIVRLDGWVEPGRLQLAQRAFAAEAETLSFNGASGFFASDPFRRMVPDVLRLERAFVDLATSPVIVEVCRRYIGTAFTLTEAKGWRSNPTHEDFHGWHNDAWYAPGVPGIPRQLKLAMYLTDVDSGSFQYLAGTHRRHRPTHWSAKDAEVSGARRTEVKGPAGTAFLFDSSGIHRQATPILEARDAVFLVYHDPATPLQDEDERAYRYHPHLLNAAFLGGLDDETQRVLGFGDQRLHRPLYHSPAPTPTLRRLVERATDVHIRGARLVSRVSGRVERVVRRAGWRR